MAAVDVPAAVVDDVPADDPPPRTRVLRVVHSVLAWDASYGRTMQRNELRSSDGFAFDEGEHGVRITGPAACDKLVPWSNVRELSWETPA